MNKAVKFILLSFNCFILIGVLHAAENWTAYSKENELRKYKESYEKERIKNIELENELESKKYKLKLEEQKAINAELRLEIEKLKQRE